MHELAAALYGLGSGTALAARPDARRPGDDVERARRGSGLAIRLDERALPVRPEVAAACEILGIDPLYAANEGKLVAIVGADDADLALSLLRAQPLGAEAAIVGEVAEAPAGMVVLDTAFGGCRIVGMLVGDPLPRIC